MENYRRASRSIATRLVGPNEVDILSQDRGDYTAQLQVVAWAAGARWGAHRTCGSDADRRDYVHEALRNQTRMIRRSRARAAANAPEATPIPPSTLLAEDERRITARHAVLALRKTVSTTDWNLLVRMAEGYDGTKHLPKAVYDPSLDVSIGALRKNIYRVRARARQILGAQNAC